MTRLPRARGREVVRALERAGFSVERTRGSHVFLKHPDGRVTSVPVRAILRDIEMSVDELIALL
jgi:predicted RNA binding protein YcfA (HicA-like mRNA interferase family)